MHGIQGPPKGGWGTLGVFLGPLGRFLTTFLKSRIFRILIFFSDSRFLKNRLFLFSSTLENRFFRSESPGSGQSRPESFEDHLGLSAGHFGNPQHTATAHTLHKKRNCGCRLLALISSITYLGVSRKFCHVHGFWKKVAVMFL